MERVDKRLDRLAELYSATEWDWDLEVHASLTEPTCPCAVVAPEGWHISRYCVHADTIDEATEKAIALVEAEVLGREVIGHAAPWTDPHDAAFEKWLRRRASGSDEKLGPPPKDKER